MRTTTDASPHHLELLGFIPPAMAQWWKATQLTPSAFFIITHSAIPKTQQVQVKA
jgi:hypothetical protein